MNKKVLLYIFSFLFIISSFAEDKIKLNSYVDKAQTNTDDEIKFTITLKHPQKENVIIPDIGPLITGLTIKEFGDKAPEIIKDVVLKEKWFILKASISGTYQLPPVEISQNNETIKTSPIFVEFKDSDKTDDKDQGDIKDIKDIYKTPFNYFWLALLVIILILSLGGFYYYKFYFRKNKISIPIPPHESALSELLKIKDIQFDSKEKAKLFSFKLSEIIRIYIEALILINVTDKTTVEIKKSLHSITSITDQHKKNLMKILEDSDLIKFADILPDNNHKNELFHLASTLIEETRPKTSESQEDLV